MSGLLIGPEQRAALAALRTRAEAVPVSQQVALEAVRTEEGRAAHRLLMRSLSVRLPDRYAVTFSIEQHKGRSARHLSMSSGRPGKVPHPHAVWMVAELLGFVGGLQACDYTWPEQTADGVVAVALFQFFDTAEAVGRPQ